MKRLLTLLAGVLFPVFAFGQASLNSTPFTRQMLIQPTLGAEQTFLGIGAVTGASLAQVTNAILQNVMALPGGLSLSGSGPLTMHAANSAGFWKNDGSGNTSWSTDGSTFTSLNASQLTSGTIPAARMPAFSGVITTSAGSTVTSFGSFSSATLRAAINDETGTGLAVFNTSPTLAGTPVLSGIAASSILGTDPSHNLIAVALSGATYDGTTLTITGGGGGGGSATNAIGTLNGIGTNTVIAAAFTVSNSTFVVPLFTVSNSVVTIWTNQNVIGLGTFNSGINSTSGGNWTNGTFSTAGVMTNDASGTIGTSTTIPESWITSLQTDLAQRVLTNSSLTLLFTGSTNYLGPAVGIGALSISSLNLSSLTANTLAILDSAKNLVSLANGGANTLLHGTTPPAYSAVVEADQSLSDVTTLNVSTTKHGYVPKLPNDSTEFLNGVGAWAVPPGGGGGSQTPWSSDINGNNKSLTNAASAKLTGTNAEPGHVDMADQNSNVVMHVGLDLNLGKFFQYTNWNTGVSVSGDTNGTFRTPKFITPTNTPVVGYALKSTSTAGDSAWSVAAPLPPLTYYVATNGSSSNNGTNRWAPLDMATGLLCLTNGNTVVLIAGKYAGGLQPANIGGTPGNNATLKSEYKWQAVIADGTFNMSFQTSPNFITNLTLDGICFSNSTSGDCLSAAGHDNIFRNLRITGSFLQGLNMSNAQCSNNIVENCYFYNNGNTNDSHFHDLYVGSPFNIVRNNVFVGVNSGGYGIQLFSGSTGVTIDHEQVYNNFTVGHTNRHGLVVFATDGASATAGTNWIINNDFLDGIAASYGTLLLTNNIILPEEKSSDGSSPIAKGTSGAAPTVDEDYNLGTNSLGGGAHDVTTTLSGIGFVNYNAGVWWLAATNSPAASGGLSSTYPFVSFFGMTSLSSAHIGAMGYDYTLAGDTRTLYPSPNEGADYWRFPISKWTPTKLPTTSAGSGISITGSLNSDGSTNYAIATSGLGNASTASNLVSYVYSTNETGTTTLVFDTGISYFTNLAAANVTLALTINSNAMYGTCVYWATNTSGADRTITCPSNCKGPPGNGNPAVMYATNNMLTELIFQHHGAKILTVNANYYGP